MRLTKTLDTMGSVEDVFTCMHCGHKILTLDYISNHRCFRGKEVFMDRGKVLFTTTVESVELTEANTDLRTSQHCAAQDESEFVLEASASEEPKTKQAAVWTNQGTLALLSLYEANKDMLDNPRKQTKLWKTISDGLLDSFGIEMSKDQVRWKINALMKKYKECIDDASKSGTGAMDFEWFEQMEQIFRQQKNAGDGFTVSSSFSFLESKPLTPNAKPSKQLTPNAKQSAVTTKPNSSHRQSVTSTSTGKCKSDSGSEPSSGSVANKSSNPTESSLLESKMRHTRGTGSKVARAKVELEKQWLSHVENKERRDAMREERHTKLFEKKKEAMKLKKEHLLMKERELETRKRIADSKLKEKANRHAELIQIEKMKCQLLRRCLKSTKDTNTSDSDD